MSQLAVLKYCMTHCTSMFRSAACNMQTAPERGAASAEGLSAFHVRPLADSDSFSLEQLYKQDAAFELQSCLSFGALISTSSTRVCCACNDCFDKLLWTLGTHGTAKRAAEKHVYSLRSTMQNIDLNDALSTIRVARPVSGELVSAKSDRLIMCNRLFIVVETQESKCRVGEPEFQFL